MPSFTEQATEELFDSVDSFCRTFWDKEGSLHWGYFDDFTSTDFLGACKRWNRYMLDVSQINSDSIVLNVGCGNGNSDLFFAQQTGCRVVGIDISGVRIENCHQKAKEYPELDLSFHKASVTNLPFESDSFTHAWSQATIYHVHEREKGLREIYRVLGDRGIFLFDDLTQPKSVVSEEGKKHVYERMLFEGTFSFESYQAKLSEIGFIVRQAIDLTPHLRRSYELLSKRAKGISEERVYSYQKMCEAMDASELGWAFFLCQKVND
jgi:ubiquinone/menaquinone biosynthesis C-methylase UbiE